MNLFDGAIKIDIWLFIVNILLILHFCISYYTDCFRKGFKVDLWHTNVLLNIFVPIFIMYPFAASELNIYATGNAIYEIQNFVKQSYEITIIGYLCSYLGYYYFNIVKKKSLFFILINNINDEVSRVMLKNISSKWCTRFFILVGMLSSIIVLYLAYLMFGIEALKFKLRDFGLANPTFRPLINFVFMSYIPILLVWLSVRFLQFREKLVLISLFLFILLGLTSGSRSALLYFILDFLIIYGVTRQRRLSLGFLGFLGFILVFIAMLLAGIRSGDSLSFADLIPYVTKQVFYGNSFSEIRDFAWILSKWDGVLLSGKSYLSSLLSFLPRYLVPFREENNFATFTLNLVFGFSPPGHGGFRPGIYGEAYFNFGIVGVIIIGFIGGYIIRYLDFYIKQTVLSREPLKLLKVYSLTIPYQLLKPFYITAGFWNNYVILLILLTGYLLRHLLLFSNKRKHSLGVV